MRRTRTFELAPPSLLCSFSIGNASHCFSSSLPLQVTRDERWGIEVFLQLVPQCGLVALGIVHILEVNLGHYCAPL